MTTENDQLGATKRQTLEAVSEPERLWEAARVAYERVLSNPAERRVWRNEIDAWDGTLLDGLDPDEMFEEPDDAGRESARR